MSANAWQESRLPSCTCEICADRFGDQADPDTRLSDFVRLTARLKEIIAGQDADLADLRKRLEDTQRSIRRALAIARGERKTK